MASGPLPWRDTGSTHRGPFAPAACHLHDHPTLLSPPLQPTCAWPCVQRTSGIAPLACRVLLARGLMSAKSNRFTF